MMNAEKTHKDRETHLNLRERETDRQTDRLKETDLKKKNERNIE